MELGWNVAFGELGRIGVLPGEEFNIGSDDDDAESDSYDEDEELAEERFNRRLQGVSDNDPGTTKLRCSGEYEFIENLTSAKWEEIGRKISNNTHLVELFVEYHSRNGTFDETISFLFQGLTRSSSLKHLSLEVNDVSADGLRRSVVPFLQNASNLNILNLDSNNIKSEGFNILLRALRDSPIEELQCNDCGIESIQIDTDCFPRHLKELSLYDNDINTDGCRGLAKLLQGRDSTLKNLILVNNLINDEGVAILVDVLQNNTSLEGLSLLRNREISKKGLVMLLKLVNDISSISATLQSNHTLTRIEFLDPSGSDGIEFSEADKEIQHLIDGATNKNKCNRRANREKVFWTQLHSTTRAAFAKAQGVTRSVFGEINPLHLPEVLSLVGRQHGQRELYVALKSSIAQIISIVNRKKYLLQQRDYYLAKVEQINSELSKIEASEEDAVAIKSSSKRRRVGAKQ